MTCPYCGAGQGFTFKFRGEHSEWPFNPDIIEHLTESQIYLDFKCPNGHQFKSRLLLEPERLP
jgi:hypothetical protein